MQNSASRFVDGRTDVLLLNSLPFTATSTVTSQNLPFLLRLSRRSISSPRCFAGSAAMGSTTAAMLELSGTVG